MNGNAFMAMTLH